MSTPARRCSPPPSATGEVTLRVLLRDRTFMLYLAGQTTSGAGSALSSIALVFAVLSVSRSASSVGLVLLASRLPGIALTLAGGVVADRWSRRRIVICADTARTVLQALTGVLLLRGHATVEVLVALQFLAGAASALFGPAASALVAGVAPRGEVRRAVSLLGITTAIAQTGGLALSGVIVALAGPGTSFLIDGATFAASSLTLALIRSEDSASPARRTVLRDLRSGWRAVVSRSWLRVYTVHETVINVLVLSPFFVLGPVLAKADLGGAPAWSAIALGYVLGNLAAAHVTYHWAPQRPVLAALIVSVGLAPMLALLGLGAPIWLVVPAALLAGAQTTVYNTLTTSALQSNLPADSLGRASAITGIGSTVLVPVGMGGAGVLASAVGTSTVLLSGAALVLAITAVCVAVPATRVPLALDLRS
jgi:MFS family permease